MDDSKLHRIESIPLVGPIWAETLLMGIALTDALNLIQLRRELASTYSNNSGSATDALEAAGEGSPSKERGKPQDFPQAA